MRFAIQHFYLFLFACNEYCPLSNFIVQHFDYFLLLSTHLQTLQVRLISEYTILNSRRSVSSTPLGIFENKSARNITYNFVFGIKLCYDTSYVTGDVIQIQFTLSTDTLTVNTQNVVFSINSMVQPPSIIPVGLLHFLFVSLI